MQHFGLLHIVAFGCKLKRRFLLDESWPGASTMKKFRPRE